MLTSILLAIFIVIIGVGTYYQIKQGNATHKTAKELHVLQMKNEDLRGTYLELQIKEQKAKQLLYEDAIKKMKEEQNEK